MTYQSLLNLKLMEHANVTYGSGIKKSHTHFCYIPASNRGGTARSPVKCKLSDE